MRVVFLVPRRRDSGERDKLWKFCRHKLEQQFPDWMVYEGHHDHGLFNRSMAINRASRLAGDWDVAIIIDSDVLLDRNLLAESVRLAVETGRFVMPFNVRKDLSRDGTTRVISGYRGSWQSFVHKVYDDMCSMAVVVGRPLWDMVGGFDEKFRGWGFEDNSFAAACETFSGQPILKLKGEAWHLWHPTAKEGTVGTQSFEANRARKDLYLANHGNKEVIRELYESSLTAQPEGGVGIPKILHRIVPINTVAQAEQWWNEFGRLHQDWELMTHRDPLDPADWPETSPYWGQCTSGAQMAGLLRLECLLKFGGIYVDQDFEPYRSFEPLLGLSCFAGWEDSKCVPDALIGASKGHPAIRDCLDLALSRMPGGAWETGPGVTTTVLPNRPDVLLFPPGTFYPYHYLDKEQKRNDNHKAQQPWALAAHHWWHSWKGK